MRDGKKTKELLTRTALSLFVEKGITETTVRDIAQAARVAEGTLYRHFVSKDDLAWELFSENFTAFAHELEQLAAAHPTLKDKVTAMVRQFCCFFDQDAVLFSYLLLAQHAQLRKVSDDMPNPVQVVRDVIAQAMSAGEMAPGDPDVMAAMVLGVVLQVAVFKVYGRVTDSLASLSDDLVAASFRVLGI